jgi:rhamnose transport system permease protein
MAALLFVARRNTAKADIGAGLELDAITAVVLGGTSIFGGRGRILGTLLGTLLIHETREFVSWRWNNDELILVVVGVLLILSVLPDGLSAARKR